MAAASVAMLWAFSASEYSNPERLRGTPAQAIIDSLNIGDFLLDMKHSLLFFLRRPHSVPHRGSEEGLAPPGYELRASGAAGDDTSFVEMKTGLSTKNKTRATVVSV
ncbi:hypothetical protein RSAG8_04368, partial [Rhizoctonia solani AG-8 WAC10335]